jgi:hypothetical protein
LFTDIVELSYVIYLRLKAIVVVTLLVQDNFKKLVEHIYLQIPE